MPFVLFVLFSVLLLIVVSGGYTFFTACRRRKELPWLDEEQMKKTTYAQFYPYILQGDRWLSEHNAQDVYIKNADGLRLHAFWIPAENPKGTILLAHGYRSNMRADFSMVFDFYHNLGLNLLVPHQRAHGESQGKYITFGVKESADMLQWIEFHNRRFGKHQMILSGLSMGASTVLYLADQPLPENVKGIIADCGFTKPSQIISHVFRRVVHLPAGPTILSADLFARIFAGFSLFEKDTIESLSKTKLPIFLVHGAADGFVPCEMTIQGHNVCTGEKTVLIVDDADHALSFLKEQEKYKNMVCAFLETNLQGF